MTQSIDAVNINLFATYQPVDADGSGLGCLGSVDVTPDSFELADGQYVDGDLAPLSRACLESGVAWEVSQYSQGRFTVNFLPIFGALETVFGHLIIDATSFVETVLVHGAPYLGSPAVGIFQGYDGFLGSLRLHEESVGGRYIHTGEDSFRDQWIASGAMLSGTRPMNFNGAAQNPRLSVMFGYYRRNDRNSSILTHELDGPRSIFDKKTVRWMTALSARIKSALQRGGI